jgi:hypothetical protein
MGFQIIRISKLSTLVVTTIIPFSLLLAGCKEEYAFNKSQNAESVVSDERERLGDQPNQQVDLPPSPADQEPGGTLPDPPAKVVGPPPSESRAKCDAERAIFSKQSSRFKRLEAPYEIVNYTGILFGLVTHLVRIDAVRGIVKILRDSDQKGEAIISNVRKSDGIFLICDASIREIDGFQGIILVDGGKIGTIKNFSGIAKVSGGGVGHIERTTGIIDVDGGSVGTIKDFSGIIHVTGGNVGDITGSKGIISVRDGKFIGKTIDSKVTLVEGKDPQNIEDKTLKFRNELQRSLMDKGVISSAALR